MKNIYVFAFATFGHPNDFRQTAFLFDQKSFVQRIELFDLPPAIKVLPDSTIYSIRKDHGNGLAAISYCIYTFAKEQHSSRDGAFIGSCITYSNSVADEEFTINQLIAFHKWLIANNTNDNVLTVNHSEQFSISKRIISDIQTSNFSLRDLYDIDDWSGSNNFLVVYSRIDKNSLCDNLKNSLLLLNKYDTIYFTDNSDVWDHCKERSIDSVIDEKDFHDEIVTIQKKRKINIQDYILHLEYEKQKWKEETNKVRSYQYDEIENSKRIHDENLKKINESVSRYEKIPSQYTDFSRLIDTYIKELNLGNSLGAIKVLYGEKEAEYSDRLNDIQKPLKMKIIQNENSNSDFIADKQNASSRKGIHKKKGPEKEEAYNYQPEENTYNILPFILGGILFLSIIFYGLWYNYNRPTNQENIEQVEQKKQIDSNSINSTLEHISPFPLHKAIFLDSGLPDLPFKGIVFDNSILFEGAVTERGGGMVLKDRIPINGANTIIIKVNGSSTQGNIFSDNRLFKLEVNNKIAKTSNRDGRCIADNDYINSKDGEYEFPLSEDVIYQKYIERFQITFYKSTIKNLSLSVWLQK